jgi:hypothetical protein
VVSSGEVHECGAQLAGQAATARDATHGVAIRPDSNHVLYLRGVVRAPHIPAPERKVHTATGSGVSTPAAERGILGTTCSPVSAGACVVLRWVRRAGACSVGTGLSSCSTGVCDPRPRNGGRRSRTGRDRDGLFRLTLFGCETWPMARRAGRFCFWPLLIVAVAFWGRWTDWARRDKCCRGWMARCVAGAGPAATYISVHSAPISLCLLRHTLPMLAGPCWEPPRCRPTRTASRPR